MCIGWGRRSPPPTNSPEVQAHFPTFTSRDDERASLARWRVGLRAAHPARTVQARHRRRRRRRRRRVEWKTTFLHPRAVPHKGWPAARPSVHMGLFGLWASLPGACTVIGLIGIVLQGPERYGEARAMAKDLGSARERRPPGLRCAQTRQNRCKVSSANILYY